MQRKHLVTRFLGHGFSTPVMFSLPHQRVLHLTKPVAPRFKRIEMGFLPKRKTLERIQAVLKTGRPIRN